VRGGGTPVGGLVSGSAVGGPFAPRSARNARHRASSPFLLHPRVPLGASGRPVSPTVGSTWPVIAGMAIAVAFVALVAVRSRPRRSAGRPRNRPGRVAGLAGSLAAGRAALEGPAEP